VAEGDELVPAVLAWAVLGRGRRFETWIGWCCDRLTPVCVKLPCRHTPVAQAVDALGRELAAASALSHPAVPRVFASSLAPPLPYLVYEFIEGRPLSAVLEDDGPLAPDQVVVLGLQLAAVLRHVHHRRFVHYDLKPANVMLRGNRAVLVDFDLALPVGVQRSTRRPRGTPGYQSPEQLRCEPAQPSMDLFALGVVLAEAAGPAPPAPLAAVLSALVDPDPARRPADAGTVIGWLEAVLPPGAQGLWPRWVAPAVLSRPAPPEHGQPHLG
jgi:serine/threonine protein kinase